MNEIKKSIEQIPLPDDLHEVAYNRLQKAAPKKTKRWMLPTVAALFLILCTTPIVFSNFISISDFFESKDQKTAAIDDSIIVVESDMFTITLKQFGDFKENKRFIHELNHIPFTLTDREMLDQLIEHELLLHEAKTHGIVVTEQEVSEYAEQTKQAMVESNDPIMTQINEELAKRLGVTAEEYFTHPSTLQQYESLLTSNNFISELYIDGVLNDYYTPDQYKADLHEKYANQLKVNQDVLKSIKD
ncbi:SurA N-terminal domain-containing protein [Sporosarcina koreensis]|uniref:SurA N-terminal domain-containing protein n=1 Tax=Sporosarcina koreensis TaxID=334735 RepID=A0ABW0U0L8_9BACL